VFDRAKGKMAMTDVRGRLLTGKSSSEKYEMILELHKKCA
jgi:hypothetical protein